MRTAANPELLGAHYCIGAALARLMGRVAFEELTTCLGDFRVDVARGRRLRAAVSRGWESLPITVHGTSGGTVLHRVEA